MSPRASTAGKLLVATPMFGDRNFKRTVVLMLAHRNNGAAGVVLNRPSGLGARGALSQWAQHLMPPSTMFIGGPVSKKSVIALAKVHQHSDESWWRAVIGQVGTIDLKADAAEVIDATEGVRLFAGYAGWAPGQLEKEIKAGAWFVVDANPEDPLTRNPNDLWHIVVSRQRSPLSWYANYPNHPSHN
ncbi:MAG: YqgE/AlgH family protein [bacterium]|nr:YqgE/AlgH family protein [bacterium]